MQAIVSSVFSVPNFLQLNYELSYLFFHLYIARCEAVVFHTVQVVRDGCVCTHNGATLISVQNSARSRFVEFLSILCRITRREEDRLTVHCRHPLASTPPHTRMVRPHWYRDELIALEHSCGTKLVLCPMHIHANSCCKRKTDGRVSLLHHFHYLAKSQILILSCWCCQSPLLCWNWINVFLILNFWDSHLLLALFFVWK